MWSSLRVKHKYTYLTILISTVIVQTNPTPGADTYYWYSHPCVASEMQEGGMQLARL